MKRYSTGCKFFIKVMLLVAMTAFSATIPHTAFGQSGDFDPVAEIEAKLRKAQEAKQKTDAAIQALKPKLQELEKAKTALEDTKEQLERLKEKMRAIRAWNLFATVMGGTMDVIQKVNPGSSAVVAIADFLQDRVEDALKDSDKKNQITMRVKRLSTLAASLSPKVRMVERRLQMTPQQVADELFARGRVDNDWVQGWNRTPDAVAKSDTVIVAKIEFILEEIGPAVGEVTNLISEVQGLFEDMYRELAGLEYESKRLTAEIHDWERQLELQGVLKESKSLPQGPPPNTIKEPYNGPAMEYGSAGSEMQKAWGDLKGGTIGGDTYRARLLQAEYGASKKMWEILKPYSEALNKAWDGAWNCRGGDPCKAAWAAYNAASRAYSAASDRENNAYQVAVTKTKENLVNEEKNEAERLLSYGAKLRKWESTPLRIRYNYWSAEEQNRDTTLGQGGYSGAGLAWSAWTGTRFMGVFAESIMYPPVGSLRGIQERYKEWDSRAKKTIEAMRGRFANMRSDDNAASALASEAPGFASELEPNIEVWNFVRWRVTEGLNYYDMRELYKRLKLYQKEYQVYAKGSRTGAEDFLKEAEDTGDRALKASSAASTEKSILEAVAKYIDVKQKVFDASRKNLDQSGTALRTFLKAYGASEEGIKTLQALVQSLSSKENIEAHALTLIPGEPGFDSKFRPPATQEMTEFMRSTYRRLAGEISTARDAYGEAFKEMVSAEATFEEGLKRMREAFAPVVPSQTPFLNRESVIREETRGIPFEKSYYITAWTPANPEDFGDSTYGLQQVIDAYVQLAEKYHAIVDPVLARVKAEHRPEARKIEELTKKMDPAWMNLDENAFSKNVNELSDEVYRIYEPIAWAGEALAGSAIATAYGAFLSRLMGLSGEYYQRIRVRNAVADLSQHIDGAKNYLGNPDTFGGTEAANAWINTLNRDLTNNESLKSVSEVATKLTEAGSVITRLKAYLGKGETELKQKVEDLYKRFKEAYESKNDSLVVACLAGTWQSGEGTTIADFQKNISRTFRVFDEIRYAMSNLQINKTGDRLFTTSYDVTITSKIYKRNIKHEEKSSVQEEVIIDASGKAKIARTTAGRFWYTQ